MTAPPSPAESERVGTHPLLIVAATVLTVFILSFVIYSLGDGDVQNSAGGGGANLAGSSPTGACGQGAPADPTYTVEVVSNPQPPRPEGTTFQLTLRHEGRPITGAKVCLMADMPDMQHPGITSVATEGSGCPPDPVLQDEVVSSCSAPRRASRECRWAPVGR
jgi:hypothetical protein